MSAATSSPKLPSALGPARNRVHQPNNSHPPRPPAPIPTSSYSTSVAGTLPNGVVGRPSLAQYLNRVSGSGESSSKASSGNSSFWGDVQGWVRSVSPGRSVVVESPEGDFRAEEGRRAEDLYQQQLYRHQQDSIGHISRRYPSPSSAHVPKRSDPLPSEHLPKRLDQDQNRTLNSNKSCSNSRPTFPFPHSHPPSQSPLQQHPLNSQKNSPVTDFRPPFNKYSIGNQGTQSTQNSNSKKSSDPSSERILYDPRLGPHLYSPHFSVPRNRSAAGDSEIAARSRGDLVHKESFPPLDLSHSGQPIHRPHDSSSPVCLSIHSSDASVSISTTEPASRDLSLEIELATPPRSALPLIPPVLPGETRASYPGPSPRSPPIPFPAEDFCSDPAHLTSEQPLPRSSSSSHRVHVSLPTQRRPSIHQNHTSAPPLGRIRSRTFSAPSLLFLNALATGRDTDPQVLEQVSNAEVSEAASWENNFRDREDTQSAGGKYYYRNFLPPRGQFGRGKTPEWAHTTLVEETEEPTVPDYLTRSPPPGSETRRRTRAITSNAAFRAWDSVNSPPLEAQSSNFATTTKSTAQSQHEVSAFCPPTTEGTARSFSTSPTASPFTDSRRRSASTPLPVSAYASSVPSSRPFPSPQNRRSPRPPVARSPNVLHKKSKDRIITTTIVPFPYEYGTAGPSHFVQDRQIPNNPPYNSSSPKFDSRSPFAVSPQPFEQPTRRRNQTMPSLPSGLPANSPSPGIPSGQPGGRRRSGSADAMAPIDSAPMMTVGPRRGYRIAEASQDWGHLGSGRPDSEYMHEGEEETTEEEQEHADDGGVATGLDGSTDMFGDEGSLADEEGYPVSAPHPGNPQGFPSSMPGQADPRRDRNRLGSPIEFRTGPPQQGTPTNSSVIPPNPNAGRLYGLGGQANAGNSNVHVPPSGQVGAPVVPAPGGGSRGSTGPQQQFYPGAYNRESRYPPFSGLPQAYPSEQDRARRVSDGSTPFPANHNSASVGPSHPNSSDSRPRGGSGESGTVKDSFLDTQRLSKMLGPLSTSGLEDEDDPGSYSKDKLMKRLFDRLQGEVNARAAERKRNKQMSKEMAHLLEELDHFADRADTAEKKLEQYTANARANIAELQDEVHGLEQKLARAQRIDRREAESYLALLNSPEGEGNRGSVGTRFREEGLGNRNGGLGRSDSVFSPVLHHKSSSDVGHGGHTARAAQIRAEMTERLRRATEGNEDNSIAPTRTRTTSASPAPAAAINVHDSGVGSASSQDSQLKKKPSPLRRLSKKNRPPLSGGVSTSVFRRRRSSSASRASAQEALGSSKGSYLPRNASEPNVATAAGGASGGEADYEDEQRPVRRAGGSKRPGTGYEGGKYGAVISDGEMNIGGDDMAGSAGRKQGLQNLGKMFKKAFPQHETLDRPTATRNLGWGRSRKSSSAEQLA